MKILGYERLRLDQLNRPSPAVRPERSRAGFARLRRSLRATGGPVTPLTVALLGSRRKKKEFVVVSGEGRLLAMEAEGFPPDHPVPCVVIDASDEEAWEVAVLENTVRENMTPFQVAAAARILVREYGRTRQEVAGALGMKSPTGVSHMVGVFDLDDAVVEALRDGVIEMGHARALTPFKEERKAQRTWLKRTIDGGWDVGRLRDEIAYALADPEERRGRLTRPGEVSLSKTAHLRFRPRAGGVAEVTFTVGPRDNLKKIFSTIRKRVRRGS